MKPGSDTIIGEHGGKSGISVPAFRKNGAFVEKVTEKSGTNPNLCYHCRTCAGGCPFCSAMDYPPHHIFRLIQFGLWREALESSTIWICVGCNTCTVQCPMAIDIPAVMDALRYFALKEGVTVAEPGILDFHREVLKSIEKYGRTHKLEIMMRYKAKTHQWFSDMDIGIKMLTKRKLELLPSKIRNTKEIRPIFNSPWRS